MLFSKDIFGNLGVVWAPFQKPWICSFKQNGQLNVYYHASYYLSSLVVWCSTVIRLFHVCRLPRVYKGNSARLGSELVSTAVGIVT